MRDKKRKRKEKQKLLVDKEYSLEKCYPGEEEHCDKNKMKNFVNNCLYEEEPQNRNNFKKSWKRVHGKVGNGE